MLSFNKIVLLVIVLLLSLASLTACGDDLTISSGDSRVTPTADVTGKPFKIGADGKLPPELAIIQRIITANNKVKSYKVDIANDGKLSSTITVIRPDRVSLKPTPDSSFKLQVTIIGDVVYTFDSNTQQWSKDTNKDTGKYSIISLAQSTSLTTYANNTLTLLPDEDFEGQKVGVFQTEGEIAQPGVNSTPTPVHFKALTRYDKNALLFRQVDSTVRQNQISTTRYYDQDSPTNVVEPPI